MLAAACEASVSNASDEDESVPEAGPQAKLQARPFLAVELQDGAVRSAGHVWVHVPDSLARDQTYEAGDAQLARTAHIVSIEPLLRTLPSAPGQLVRQVFQAHAASWGAQVVTAQQAHVGSNGI